MTDQTHIAPTTPMFTNMTASLRQFFAHILSRKTRKSKKQYRPAKRFSAGFSPDTVAHDWGHMQNHNGDPSRRF